MIFLVSGFVRADRLVRRCPVCKRLALNVRGIAYCEHCSMVLRDGIDNRNSEPSSETTTVVGGLGLEERKKERVIEDDRNRREAERRSEREGRTNS